ncbi:MAG TPA: NUDIX hydrolase [Steroidobacteraceae bacterium]|nr:NUDIX hydrolase [Steroidobacteraceae bacterium]
MALNPAVTVAALAERDGRFLVVEERIDGRIVLNQPAGHLEDGETLLQAVAREAREETAWRFTPRALLGVYLWHHPDSGHSVMRFAFTGIVSDHDPLQPLDQGILATHWLTRRELIERSQRLRSPLVLRCVDDYLAGHRHPLETVALIDGHPPAWTASPLPASS